MLSSLSCAGKRLQGGALLVLKNLKVKFKRLSHQNTHLSFWANEGLCSLWESSQTPLNSCTFYAYNSMLQHLFRRQKVNFCKCQKSVSHQRDLDWRWSQKSTASSSLTGNFFWLFQWCSLWMLNIFCCVDLERGKFSLFNFSDQRWLLLCSVLCRCNMRTEMLPAYWIWNDQVS